MNELNINNKISDLLINEDILSNENISKISDIISCEFRNIIERQKDVFFNFICYPFDFLIFNVDFQPNININKKYFPYFFKLNITNTITENKYYVDFSISHDFKLFLNNEPYSQVLFNNIFTDYLSSIDKVYVSDINVINIINLFYFPKQHSDISFYSILTNKELLKDFAYKFLTYEHAEAINNFGQRFYKIDINKKINNIKKEDINIYNYFSNSIESTFSHVFITQLQILIPEFKHQNIYGEKQREYKIKSNIPRDVRKHLTIYMQTQYESNNNIPYIKLSTNGGYSKELRLNEDPFDFIDNCLFDIKEIYANWYKLYSDDYYCSRLELVVKNQLKEKNFHITKLNEFSIVFSHNKDWFGDIFFNLSYQNFIIGANINFEEFNSNSDNIMEYLTIGMNNFELSNIIEHSTNKITNNNNKTRL